MRYLSTPTSRRIWELGGHCRIKEPGTRAALQSRCSESAPTPQNIRALAAQVATMPKDDYAALGFIEEQPEDQDLTEEDGFEWGQRG